ncbi:hypothetical protein ACOSQ4_033117 [Xanthoceras sorbifolium]
MAEKVEERTLEETPTWAVAVVCFVFIAISIALEHLIHMVGKWLNNRHKRALFEALEKVKAELMLMGFISLLLTMGQGIVSEICVSKSIANSWHPCTKEEETSKYGSSKDITIGLRRLLSFFYSATASTRRSLAAKKYDKCAEKGQVAFVSAYGIHQLHIFIFVLAVFHVLYCITTLALGRTKMKKWKGWEDETRTVNEYQYYNERILILVELYLKFVFRKVLQTLGILAPKKKRHPSMEAAKISQLGVEGFSRSFIRPPQALGAV